MPSRRPLTIIDALYDPLLLGAIPCFQPLASWSRWLVFLKAVYGLDMTKEEEGLFRYHTGLPAYVSRPDGYKEAVAITGRQAGKDRIGSVIQAYEAIMAQPEPDGTELYALSIAQDAKASLRTAFKYAATPFDIVPHLKQSVLDRKTESVTLNNGIVLVSYPCRPEAVRGLRGKVAVCSELAFFMSSDFRPTDTEMLRAIRPTLATTGGRLIILSSPYGQSGALWDLDRRHFGKEDSNILIWHGTAPEMNPTLAPDYLQKMEQDDPEAYRSEVLGEFRAGVSTFFDPDTLNACIDDGIRERPYQSGIHYHAFLDSASGTGKDALVLAIGHKDAEHGVVDVIRAYAPPFNPSGVIAEVAGVCKGYQIDTIMGDRYAPGFVIEAFGSHGLRYQFTDQTRSDLYLELLPLVNAQRIRLLDDPELLRELRGLERRRGPSGRDKVDHRPGFHDDRANAATGALVRVLRYREPLLFIGGGDYGDMSDDKLYAERAQQSAEAIKESCLMNGYWWPHERL